MRSVLLVAAVLWYAATAWAVPAAWYKWRSPQSDYDLCAQVSPGEGWEVVGGPFQDSGCKKPGVPH